jgi:hypothetical protein
MMNQMGDMSDQMSKTGTKMSKDYIKQMKSLYNTIDGSMANMMYMIRTGNPEIKNYVWPWNNFDFDYSKYIYNKYDPAILKTKDSTLEDGISSDGFLDVTQDNLDKIRRGYRDTLRKDAIPHDAGPDAYGNNQPASVAGATGKEHDVLSDAKEVQKVKKKYNSLKEPYNGFKKEYKHFFDKKFGKGKDPTGKFASSYFIKSGNCPVPGIKNMMQCKAKGFTWNPMRSMIDDSMRAFFPGADTSKDTSKCFKPRYAFIDNSPGTLYPGSNDEGMIPTIAKTMANLNPMELSLAATYGRTSDGSYYLLPCNPSKVDVSNVKASEIITEKFTNKYSFFNSNKILKIIILLLIIFSILYVIFSYVI